eukprot:TRINITY_DN22796_c0_g1_i1.p1 TRINITY_DN22796_c0_g1~~TRINITY_DN22796_c0_g1_i1.p1  ORF type:complete len:956 (+),score=195.45 TRINITY_DN22796_c0_g1_i1:87-2954(+)
MRWDRMGLAVAPRLPGRPAIARLGGRPAVPRRRKRVRLRLSGCLALLAAVVTRSLCMLSFTRAVAASELLDFANAQPALTSQEDVIVGEVLIEGEVPMGLVMEIALIVRQTIAELVAIPITFVKAQVSGDLQQLSEPDGLLPRVLIRFAYHVMPPRGGAEAAVKELVAAGRETMGGRFEQIFTTELSEYEPTVDVNYAGWLYTLPLPKANKRLVVRPVDMPVYSTTTAGMFVEQRSTTPAPTYMPLYRKSPCLAAGMPCSCAALVGCEWVENEHGLVRCQAAAEGSESLGVPCSACPTQAHCPAQSCAALGQPCACADAPQCRWSDEEDLCVVVRAGAEATSCRACARQEHCSPPELVRVVPPSGTQLVLPAQLQLRLEFDRAIMLGSAGTVSFRCDNQKLPTDVANDHLTTDGKVLLVSVASLTSGASRLLGGDVLDCALLISAGRVKDKSGVPFLGLGAGVYSFRLGDSTAPSVAAYEPRNGEQDVKANTVVTFTFDEEVSLGPAAASLKATLSELGDAAFVGSGSEVKVELTPPRVSVQSRQLRLNLADHVENGKHYTVSLPRGAVVDRAANVFEGLPLRVYAFRTVPAATIVHQGPPDDGLVLTRGTLIAVLSAGALLVLLCIGTVWRVARIHRSHVNHLKTAGVKLSTVRPTTADRIAIEVERSKSVQSSSPDDLVTGRASSRTQLWTEAQQLGSPKRGGPSPSSPHGSSGRSAAAAAAAAFAAAAAAAGDDPVSPGLRAAAGATDRRSEAQRRWDAARAHARRNTAPAPTGFAATVAAAKQQAAQAKAAQAAAAAYAAAAAHGSDDDTKAPQGHPPLGRSRSASLNPSGRSRSHQQPRSSPTQPDAEAPPRRGSGGLAGPPRAGGSGDGHSTPISLDSVTDPETEELERQKAEVERRMRSQMDAPVEDRKRILRELMLQYHPDKNSAANAKEVFQFVNASRSWFLPSDA